MSRQFRSDDTDKWKYAFGDGSDGDLVVSTNTTDSPIDASCSGTIGDTTLSATNTSFAAGQIVLIHQTRGETNYDIPNWELNKITSYTTGTITLTHQLTRTYIDSGDYQAQVLVLKQYNSVTINSGVTLAVKNWTGDTGGIMAFLCKEELVVNGTLKATGSTGASYSGSDGTGSVTTGGGFRGGAGKSASSGTANGGAGEGTAGESYLTGGTSNSANGNGGGGCYATAPNGASGGGGGNGTAGTSGGGGGGTVAGNSDLTNMALGGGGGGNGCRHTYKDRMSGGSGGGIIIVIAKNIVTNNSTSINATGGAAGYNGSGLGQAGGAGAGGSVLLKCKTATLTGILAPAGAKQASGGSGGVGRIHLDYSGSYTGTTSPTLSSRQDSSIVEPQGATGNFFAFM